MPVVIGKDYCSKKKNINSIIIEIPNYNSHKLNKINNEVEVEVWQEMAS